MTLILSLHPSGLIIAILFACCAAYLGLQRTKSLHFNKTTRFYRGRHVNAGAIALFSMPAGIAAGSIMVNRYLLSPDMGLHVAIAMIILVLGLFGIISGFCSIS